MISDFQFIVIDTSKVPIIVIKVKDVDPSIHDYQAFLDAMTQLLNQYSDVYWIFDAKHMKMTSSQTRIMAGNWLKREGARIKSNVKAVYFIRSSFWTTMVLKAIFVVAKLPVPLQLLPELADVEKLIASDVAP
jgi:hypothetical protein